MEYTNPEPGIFRHEAIYCPHECGYKFDSARELNEKNVAPAPDDVSICIKCGGLMEISDMGEWTILTERTKDNMIAELPHEWAKLINLQYTIRTKGKIINE